MLSIFQLIFYLKVYQDYFKSFKNKAINLLSADISVIGLEA